MNIGEVVTLLEAEFPEVTVSKLRFLESEGLLRPLRSTGGYRRYGEGDVARITRILRLQRDQHLPLKVIAGLLDQSEPTDEVDGLAPAFRDIVDRRSRTTGARAVDGMLAGSVSVSKGELASMVGLDEATLSELERLGLVKGREAGARTVYDDEAVLVGRMAACFVGHGFDIRHLRMYLVAAQREAGLLEQVVGPVVGVNGEGSGRPLAEARRLVDELADAGSALHELLLRRELGSAGR